MMQRVLQSLICLTLLVALRAAFGGDIVLRSSIRMAEDATVSLGDVAALFGEDAQKYAELPLDVGIAKQGSRVREVSLDDVRIALREAGASFGRLTLSGSTCRILAGGTEPAPESEEPTRTDNVAEIVSLEGPPTVRRTIAAHLAGLYEVDPENLRLRFQRDDHAFVDASQWGRQVVLQPTTTASSKRMLIEVRTYADRTLLEARNVAVEAEVMRDIFVVRHDVQRGDSLTENAVMATRLWLSPAGSPPLTDIDEINGSTARSRLLAGTVLRASSVKAPILVRRNELVDVYCVVGGVEIVTRARAMDQGRRDDVIELRLERGSRSFTARVAGRGVVAMDMAGVETRAEGDGQ